MHLPSLKNLQSPLRRVLDNEDPSQWKVHSSLWGHRPWHVSDMSSKDKREGSEEKGRKGRRSHGSRQMPDSPWPSCSGGHSGRVMKPFVTVRDRPRDRLLPLRERPHPGTLMVPPSDTVFGLWHDRERKPLSQVGFGNCMYKV